MKRLFATLLLLMVVMSIGLSQTVFRIEDTIFLGKRFTNSSADSTQSIPLRYSGDAYPLAYGAMPDSIVISWFAKAPSDSISGDLYFQARSKYATSYTSTLVDSIKAAETDYKVITRTLYSNRDLLGIRFNARSAGNGILTANANALYMRVERYFTVSSIRR